jgi:transposase
LKTESKKNRKQKRTLKQLHAELMSLGYEGSYNRVAAFAREWKADLQIELQTTGRGTFVPLAFEPGEAFQFDWSEDWAIIGNERTKLQVAHTKLSYSRAFIVRAYLLQTHGSAVPHSSEQPPQPLILSAFRESVDGPKSTLKTARS